MDILIVGAGITGALIGFFLRKQSNNIRKLDLWEATGELGGRMKTSKLNANQYADIGLQYISTDKLIDDSYKDVYKLLQDNYLLEPLKCKILNSRRYSSGLTYFVAPNGASSLVEYFIDQTNYNNICYNKCLNKIDIDSNIKVASEINETKFYDIVILTMPVPQLFEISGNYISRLNNDLHEMLSAVTFSSRFVLINFYEESIKSEWGAQYIKDDLIFRYVAVDNIKRNQLNTKSTVIFHTDVEFGKQHINDSLEDVELILKTHARKLFSNWPDPYMTKCYQWKHSQVISEVKTHQPFVSLVLKPLLIVSGDSLMGSKFDNCIFSAKETVNFILDKITV